VKHGNSCSIEAKNRNLKYFKATATMAKKQSFLNLRKLTFRVKETGQIHKNEAGNRIMKF
jgi:hypothetical protein